MRKTTVLSLIVLATAACGDRPAGGPAPAASAPATNAPAAAADAAGVGVARSASHKISVKLKKQDGRCVVEEPRRETVLPGDSVRWKFMNNCGEKKTQKIDRLKAPISGDCQTDTDIEDSEEKEGKDCKVDDDAQPGRYKYKIDGSVVLDPELDIPPPPPPMEVKAEPTPNVK